MAAWISASRSVSVGAVVSCVTVIVDCVRKRVLRKSSGIWAQVCWFYRAVTVVKIWGVSSLFWYKVANGQSPLSHLVNVRRTGTPLQTGLF
ncbi:hypothetical protein D3C85_795340 [compost metagenome]